MSRHVSPSILAADFSRLGSELEKVNNSHADWIHCDVMDGVFVPNISFGIPIIESIRTVAEKPLDVHLMIVEPERYIDRFCSLGIDILTVHQEACSNLSLALQQIRRNGVKAGVSLRPQTPPEALADAIADIDIILIMSVNPGFGGQDFMESTYKKVSDTKEMILKSNSGALIQVDGGVNLQNARKLYDSGVDILITGTTVFKSDDPAGMIDKLLKV